MSAIPGPKSLSPEEYLAIERASRERHEYFQGEMFAMGGASLAHNEIALAISSRLYNALRDTSCTVAASDLRVRISGADHYVYPDIVVTCQQPRFEDDQLDTLINPQAIIEVLSESTETYDRGKKFEQYRQIESLREYLLVAQDRAHVERFQRDDSGAWVLTEATGLDAAIELASIGCSLQLAEVYARVFKQ
ncbi:MAG: hypothetical protein CMJ58_10685 [Planctomycetaceae bacterium]|nr:hypothetical protein [Planctomycetaceae bacterium]